MKKLVMAIALASLSAWPSFAGPYLTTGEGAFVGGALGAGVGALVGSPSGRVAEGALIGAGVGAVSGAIITNSASRPRYYASPVYYSPPPPPPVRHVQVVHRPVPVRRVVRVAPMPVRHVTLPPVEPRIVAPSGYYRVQMVISPSGERYEERVWVSGP